MRRPITRAEYNKLVRQVRDALNLASTHDPEHQRSLTQLYRRVANLERRLEMAIASQPRRITRKLKGEGA